MRIDSLSPMMARSLLAALPKAVPGLKLADEAAPRAPAAQGAQPMPTVQMLVALAATEGGVALRKQLARKAERGLDALEDLHRELLIGGAGPERLREIADWAATFELTDDPMLAELMTDIDLRVRVELAKVDVRA